jgi:hypothetical protein
MDGLPIPCPLFLMSMVWRLILNLTLAIEDWTLIVIIVVMGTAHMKG